MRRATIMACAAVLTLLVVIAAPPGSAQGGSSSTTRLRGFEEVPAISTPGGGTFTAQIAQDSSHVAWTLSYSALQGAVTQAHIHFGQAAVNGGISVFFCTNLGNGPAGTPACPPAPATITGQFTGAHVVGPAAQGIAATELGELLMAIRAGVTYANVHSDVFPGGEIRGQILFAPAGGPG